MRRREHGERPVLRTERWESWSVSDQLIPGCSQESLQFLYRQVCVSQNAAQGSLGDVAAGMNWHGSATPVGMTHDVVAPGDPGDFEASSL
jgi:hypothetical protein